MKFWIVIIQIIVLAFLLQLFLPWWAVAIAGAVGGYNAGGKRPFRNFMAGFLGIFLFWAGYTAVLAFSTGSPLPDMMGEIIAPFLSGTLMILVTGLVGGLAGGFGALAGGQFRWVMNSK